MGEEYQNFEKFDMLVCYIQFNENSLEAAELYFNKCKHYFCRKCALEHYKKSMRCFVCNAQITTFNPARNLIARLKKMEEEKKQSESDSD